MIQATGPRMWQVMMLMMPMTKTIVPSGAAGGGGGGGGGEKVPARGAPIPTGLIVAIGSPHQRQVAAPRATGSAHIGQGAASTAGPGFRQEAQAAAPAVHAAPHDPQIWVTSTPRRCAPLRSMQASLQ